MLEMAVIPVKASIADTINVTANIMSKYAVLSDTGLSGYDWLLQKYDPKEVFWCWRCVGSEGWTQQTDGQQYGPLCEVN